MRREWIYLGIAFVIWIFLLFLLMAGRVYAHDAPSGRSYDPACCNTMDCRPADGPDGPRHHPIQLVEVQGGYRVIKTNGQDEMVDWNSKRVRPSKDGDYHVCTHGGRDDGGVICIYVPPKGF